MEGTGDRHSAYATGGGQARGMAIEKQRWCCQAAMGLIEELRQKLKFQKTMD
jgi:hypothetical protein